MEIFTTEIKQAQEDVRWAKCSPEEVGGWNVTIIKNWQNSGASKHWMEAILGFLNGNAVFGLVLIDLKAG